LARLSSEDAAMRKALRPLVDVCRDARRRARLSADSTTSRATTVATT
jgi:hypothetical protein